MGCGCGGAAQHAVMTPEELAAAAQARADEARAERAMIVREEAANSARAVANSRS